MARIPLRELAIGVVGSLVAALILALILGNRGGGSPSEVRQNPTVTSLPTLPSKAAATSTPTNNATPAIPSNRESAPTTTVAPTPVQSAPTAPILLPPTATAQRPPSGTVVYDADWNQGLDGWPTAYGWKVLSGTYINDASDSSDRNHFVSAPYIPEQANLPNYAIETDIQLVREDACGTFGLVARSEYYAGRQASGGCEPGTGVIGVYGGGELKTAPVSPDNAWHSYRLEVRDNNLRLYLDGALVIETNDNRYLTGGTAGLFAWRSQVVVRSFKITSLG